LRFLAGTPPVLSTACIEPGLDLLLEAGMDRVRTKSTLLSEFLIRACDEQLAPFGVTLATPREAARRGSHVSMRHPDAWRLTQALVAEHEVIPDFRGPDLIRFGLAPLYNSFAEVFEAVERLRRALEDRAYLRYPEARLVVP
jgi:kynureninase